MPKRDYYFPSRQLVSQQDSATIQKGRVSRSTFINKWSRITAFDAAMLIPILVDEILPGDHMRYNLSAYIRLSTPLFPLFSNQRVDTHWFFVPNRLVWDNWVKMMGEQTDPGDSIAFTVPTVSLAPANLTVNSLWDHFNLPIGMITGTLEVQNLPGRMYNLIWNTWFRDQNIQDSAVVDKDNGPDSATDYFLRPRGKSHDYFTTCLPEPQKFPAPSVPLVGNAPVKGIGSLQGLATQGNQNVFETQGTATYVHSIASDDPVGDILFRTVGAGPASGLDIYADLSAVSGVSINTLRQAWMVQSLLERDARGGTRYTELLRAHFDVISPDARLQRPEYIGGGSSPLNITPIATTAPTDGVPVGALGAAGTATGQHSASYAATEHGFVIALLSIRSELGYQQGVHRQWTRSSRYDYAWPELTQLGEQAVLRKEIYAVGGADDQIVFGYQERYHEYRTKVSEVTGIMRSTVAETLDTWHLVQSFATPPTLSPGFIVDDPPMFRVLAAAEEADNQQYLADLYFQRVAVRPLPVYGTPAALGRF